MKIEVEVKVTDWHITKNGKGVTAKIWYLDTDKNELTKIFECDGVHQAASWIEAKLNGH